MKTLTAVGAVGIALGLAAATTNEAEAVAFGTVGDRASFTLSGELTFSDDQDTSGNGSPDLGESFTLSNTPGLTGGSQTQEFNAIVDPTASGAPTLAPGTPDIKISDGPDNVGFQLTFGYNRSLGGLGGSETGELTFTIDDVLSASVGETGGTNIISLTAIGTITDSPDTVDFYDDNQPFSLSFTGTVADLNNGIITGSYSATFSSPPNPQITTEVPLPAAAILFASGLAAFATLRDRRRY